MNALIGVLILSILGFVIANNESGEKDIVDVEDTSDKLVNNLLYQEFKKKLENNRKSRILWPYPVMKENDSKENSVGTTNPDILNETKNSKDERKENSARLKNNRMSRILWPYPVIEENSDGKTNPEVLNETNNSKDERKEKSARFFQWPNRHNLIVDMMMDTISSKYATHKPDDPFDFIRDSYPLSKGATSAPDEYDYIIVGGGTAGSVLAARLTEDKPKATVLLLEAGKPEMLLTDIPALTHYFQLTDYVWPYTMEHQPGVCLGSEDQRCYMPRGKALGGHSVTNNMIYARSRPEDWNKIAADGNHGWSYKEILQYYLKSEKSELKKYKTETYRGRDGELTVENIPFKTGLIEAFLSAGRDLGHPTIDYNCPESLGFGYAQTISNKGHRLSTAKAFLHPHKRRKNLYILTEARGAKVLVEPQTKRAYAVEYIRNNVKYTARCRREAILSAGPLASPQLLMLSGIGPRENLQNLGIPVISDLQVGRSLYDHISFPGIVFKLNTTNASLLEPKVATLQNLMQWLQFGDGLITTPGGIEGIGYLKTSLSQDSENIPDIELISMGGSLTSDSGEGMRKSWKITDKTYYKAFGSLNGMDTWQAIPVLLHPKSKGYLELRDTNPFSHPKLFGNYLTDPRDIATLKEAINFIIQLGKSEQFKKYNATLHEATYPKCEAYSFGSNPYWECAIRTMLVSLRRPISTCKMGPLMDPEAVVDSELRVYGVEGLRVVDSSIIPRTMSSDTSTQEILIAEKAADMIKRTWANILI